MVKKNRGRLLIILDLISIFTATAISYFIRFGELTIQIDDIILWTLSIFIIFYTLELYDNFSFSSIILRGISGIMVSGMIIIFLSFTFLEFFIGRGLFALQALSIAFFTIGWRVLFHSFATQIIRPSSILLYGPRRIAAKVAEDIRNNESYDIKDVVFYENLPDQFVSCETIATWYAPIVVFIDDPNMPPEVMKHLIHCRMKGIPLKEVVDFYEDAWEKVPVYHLSDRWFVYSRGFTVLQHVFYQRVKGIADILTSIIVILLSSPVMLLIGLLIKIESRGPVFYRQERVGKDGKVFTLIKFRSMVHNAEENGAVWAREGDPRVTRIGRFLRRFRLDELPQLFNILKGEMSFVGPRPERPVFVKQLEKEIPYYNYRHIVQPGLSGLAQVNYSYGASVEDAINKLEYELFYIKNSSFMLDLKIILKTVRVVLFSRGR